MDIQAILQQAMAHLLNKELASCQSICQSLLAVYPEHPAFLWILSEAFKAQGEYGFSEILKQRALYKDSDTPLKLGMSYEYLPLGHQTPNLLKTEGWSSTSVSEQVSDDFAEKTLERYAEPHLIGSNGSGFDYFQQTTILAFLYVLSQVTLQSKKHHISMLDWGGEWWILLPNSPINSKHFY
jgi:hypothetical protein